MTQVLSQRSNRKALFTPNDAPSGGTCLSTFLIVSKGKEILVGKMQNPEIWMDRFFVGEKFAPVYASSGKYVLPASHLSWYESPLDAAYRVATEQALLSPEKRNFRLVDAQSHVREDPKDPEGAHWDICFVYDLPFSGGTNLKTPEWFQELRFVDKAQLKPSDFTRGHGDVLEEAGIIK